jgi:23S rRNA pseudouridine2605 synthase
MSPINLTVYYYVAGIDIIVTTKYKKMTEKNINLQNMEENTFNLSHFLSLCGIASRRKCADIVKAGLVKINGQTVTGPGSRVREGDDVVYDGRPVRIEPRVYIMLNKPRGYVCTNDDPHAEKRAFDLIEVDGARLFSAGRLDKDSEGLLIITNDGDYAMQLTHPRHEIFKTYLVKTDTAIPAGELNRLRRGIIDDGERLLPQKIEDAGGCIYRFILNEGKKREIRRMIAAAGRNTVSLQRISVGALMLGALESGKWRFLSDAEVKLSLLSGFSQS